MVSTNLTAAYENALNAWTQWELDESAENFIAARAAECEYYEVKVLEDETLWLNGTVDSIEDFVTSRICLQTAWDRYFDAKNGIPQRH